MTKFQTALACAFLTGSFNLYAEEERGIEEILVTAQRTTESIQDVPIAVSAFNNESLAEKQIDAFSDLRFHVPNVTYNKTNFTGNNFQIRGIGAGLTAASSDGGVGMHINDVYVNAPRIFETEYYDMEQVEVLRGPQGTLFGRNATGGVVNLKTARPVIGESLYNAEAQVGNFGHTKIKGAVNVPISDTAALRLAGIWLERDGYTDNDLGGDFDNRDQWSARMSLRWEPTDNTRFDLIAHRFEEDSNRSRSQKQLCDQDPSAILGCLPTSLVPEAINEASTAGFLLASDLLVGPLGAFSFFGRNPDPDCCNPTDFRRVRTAYTPEYKTDENFVMLEIAHEFENGLEMNVIAAHQETDLLSRQDYNGTAAGLGNATVPPAFCVVVPGACAYFGMVPGGGIPASLVPNAETSLGAIAGGADDFELTTRGGGLDLSGGSAEQDSVEIRFTSNLDGAFNYMVAANIMDFESDGNYFVQSAGLDYGAMVLAPQTGSPNSFLSLAPGYFNSETQAYKLESTGIFGEIYWQATDDLKITFGLRYVEDEKSVQDRQVFLNVPVLVDVASRTTTFLGSDGSATPVSTVDELISAAAAVGDYDADPNTPGGQDYRFFEDTFEDTTGRIVIDFTPTDDNMFYLSYSKGYKSGGINPPIDTNLFPNTPETFEPEEIDAYELGTKNTLLDGKLQANASVFFYDYGNYQIGKIVNRTSLNENSDADIQGFEAEFLWAPSANWRFNASLSYLDTEIADTETVDPRDPTQGRQDVTLYKDFVTAANCVLEHNGLPAPGANPAFVGTVQGAGAPYLQTGPAGGLGIAATPGVVDSAFSSCAAIAAVGPLFGYGYLDSVPTNIGGNRLQNAPELSLSLGAEYTWFLGNGSNLSARLDYYWQDEFYSTTFNRPQDLIESWDIYNARFVWNSASDKWSITAFVQNIEDDDEIAGTYQTDPSSGLYTNVFLIEPRLVGLTFQYRN